MSISILEKFAKVMKENVETLKLVADKTNAVFDCVIQEPESYEAFMKCVIKKGVHL